MEAILLNNKLRILYSKLGLDGTPRIIPNHYSDIEIDSNGRIFIAACRGFGYTYHYDCYRKLVNGEMSEIYRFVKRRAGGGEIICVSEDIVIDNEERKLCVPLTIGRHAETYPEQLDGDWYPYYWHIVDGWGCTCSEHIYEINSTNKYTILDLTRGVQGSEGLYKDTLAYSSSMMIWRGDYLYYLNNEMNIVVLNCEDLSYVKTIELWRDVVDEATTRPSNLNFSSSLSPNEEEINSHVTFIYPKGLVRNKENIYVIFVKKERREEIRSYEEDGSEIEYGVRASSVLYDNITIASISADDTIEINVIREIYLPKQDGWRALYSTQLIPIYFKDDELYWVRTPWVGSGDTLVAGTAYVESSIVNVDNLDSVSTVSFFDAKYERYFNKGILYKTNVNTLVTEAVLNVLNSDFYNIEEASKYQSGNECLVISVSVNLERESLYCIYAFTPIGYVRSCIHNYTRWDVAKFKDSSDTSDYDGYNYEYASECLTANGGVFWKLCECGCDLIVRGFGEIADFGIILDGSQSNVVLHKEDRPTDFFHRLPVEASPHIKVPFYGCMCSDLHYKLKYGLENLTNFYRNKLCLIAGDAIDVLESIPSVLTAARVNLFHAPLSSTQIDDLEDAQDAIRETTLNGISLATPVLTSGKSFPRMNVFLNTLLLNKHDYTYESGTNVNRTPRASKAVVLLSSITNLFTNDSVFSMNHEDTPQITSAHINYKFLLDSLYNENFSHFAHYSIRNESVSGSCTTSYITANYSDSWREASVYKAIVDYNRTKSYVTSMADMQELTLAPAKHSDFYSKIININPLILVAIEQDGDLFLGTINRNYWSDNLDSRTFIVTSFRFLEHFLGSQHFLFGSGNTRFYVEKKEENLLSIRIFGKAALVTHYVRNTNGETVESGLKIPLSEGTLLCNETEHTYVDLKFQSGPDENGIVYFGLQSRCGIIDGLITLAIGNASLINVGDTIEFKEAKLTDATSGMSLLKHDIFTGFKQTGINSSYIDRTWVSGYWEMYWPVSPPWGREWRWIERHWEYIFGDGIEKSRAVIEPLNSTMIAPTDVSSLETVSTVIEECDYVAGTFQRLSGGSALVFVGVINDETGFSDVWCYVTQDGDTYIKCGKLLSEVPIQKIGVRQIHGRFCLTYFDFENVLHLAQFDHSFTPIENENEMLLTELAEIVQDKYTTEINYV